MKKVAKLPVGVNLSDPRHLMRFLKRERGDTDQDIAAEEHVSVATVRNSIKEVRIFRQVNSQTEMDIAIRNVVIETAPKMKRTLDRLLNAKNIVRVKNSKTGKEEDIQVDDKSTQLDASRVVKELMIGLQPKSPVAVVNNNQQNNNATVVMSKAETTEERLARLRKKAAEANLLPAETAAVPDHLDRDETPEDNDDDLDEEEGDDEDDE